jgi:hypothetical protein
MKNPYEKEKAIQFSKTGVIQFINKTINNENYHNVSIINNKLKMEVNQKFRQYPALKQNC